MGESWACSRGVQPVYIDDTHRAWLEKEHERFARRLVRLNRRGLTADNQHSHSTESTAIPDSGMVSPDADDVITRLTAHLVSLLGTPSVNASPSPDAEETRDTEVSASAAGNVSVLDLVRA